MIEDEEQIVNYLEDIDSTFSSINRRLKEILAKICEMKKVNTKVIKDFEPIMKMFNVKKTDSVSFKEDEEELPNQENSSIIFKTSSPKNPFMDTVSSELINKTIMQKAEAKESSSTIDEYKYTCSFYEDSSSSELKDFDISKIPTLFQNEEHLRDVYNFIKQRGSVSFEELIERFENVDCEKVVIYLDVLRNKKFIKRRENIFFVVEK
ncbi:hypothetical protein NGRA_2390 [Nosema granulosis]|uniref:Uncharacterized protein n=1 Tax=Nosema granulosis TaxID=83296 RepID=A0A9P6GWR7_9MICR|nr:hypothetical protein NGRA_2390 [Nosema granulosis]